MILSIRPDQMQAFETVALKDFEDEMVQHLTKFAPKHCEVIQETGVRQTIRIGIERGRKHGLTNRGPLGFYIELMFMFGSAFDTDPLFAWAGESLRADVFADQTTRADLLFERMEDYLAKAAGPENRFILRSLREVSTLGRQPLPVSPGNFEDEMLTQLKRVYPEKCDHCGSAALRTLIRAGVQAAEACGTSTMQGRVVFVVLMFALGHGFADDPLFPWASRTLQDPRITDADSRARRLQSKALSYLDNVLNYFAQEQRYV